ncbi:MAG: chalcone isomerase family protein, partial [Gammaproteobacteria bacterium]|nr:chalcone isomerase family protein [Gammaproteobacteria bacterium]
MKTLLILLFSLFISLSLHAQTVANIDIPDTVSHSSQSTKLILNGAGIRSKFIFDIYVGSLY